MTDVVRNVRLYGKLGAKFGRCFRLAVQSPAEAIQALGCQLPGFNEYLMGSKDRGENYAVFVGKKNIPKEELLIVSEDQDIRIAPIPQGAKKRGILQIIVGIVLIVVGIIASPFTGGASISLVYAGAGMIIGGIIQMLTPTPKGRSAEDRKDTKPSYYFNGTVNTTAQGHPTPLLYGRKKIGSAVISAGISVDDNSVYPYDGVSIIGGGSFGDFTRYLSV